MLRGGHPNLRAGVTSIYNFYGIGLDYVRAIKLVRNELFTFSNYLLITEVLKI